MGKYKRKIPKVDTGVDFFDNACKVLFAADIFRHAVEVQEKCRDLPERTERQLDLKIRKLEKAEKRLASIEEEVHKLK